MIKFISRNSLALALLFALFLLLWVGRADALMVGQEAHEKLIYPVVRVNNSGSGTIIYSKLNEDEKYSTYVLTNWHVISDRISIASEWDTDLQKEIKKEKRGIVYVEIFKYKNLSTPIGTLRVEADIVLYNKDEDVALIKLRTETKQDYVATLIPRNGLDNLYTMDETIAVGCSLGFPPVPTRGMLTRKNFYISSLPFHMSSAQIIFGNSGGAMYTGEALLIGIPSRVPVIGWSSAVTHMGLFIPIERIYDWLEDEYYYFIYDAEQAEKECLETRETELEKKKKGEKD